MPATPDAPLSLSWSDLELFLAVAETGSFSSAARRLRVTQPTVSRRVAALEETLASPLFLRNVEGAKLSEAGERLVPAAQQMARWAAEAGRSVASFSDAVEGVVRLAAPPGLGYDLIVPLARVLRERLPSIRLELLTGIEHIDLARGQADLALRTRRPTQSDLMTPFGVRAELGVFASEQYAQSLQERKPGPLSVADLDWVTWSYPNEHLPPRPDLERLIPRFKPAFASNDYLAQQRAVSFGLGAMILPNTYHSTQSMERLVRLPVTLPLPIGGFYVVCAKTMRWVPRVQAVIEQLRELLLSVEGTEAVE